MRHLNQWIIKELHPVLHQKSKTTNSYYYTVNGLNIRLSDHLGGHNNNDIYITVAKDISTLNKNYQIQYGQPINVLACNQVSEVKTVLKTIIAHLLYCKECQKVEHSIMDNLQKYIRKLIKNGQLSSDEKSMLIQYIIRVFPKFNVLTNELKDLYFKLLQYRYTIEEVNNVFITLCPNIIETGFSFSSKKANYVKDTINSLYFPVITANPEKSEIIPIVVKDTANNINTVKIIPNALKFKDIFEHPYSFDAQGTLQNKEILLRESLTKYIQCGTSRQQELVGLRFHELMVELFNKKWSKSLSTNQKYVFKNLVSKKNIPYNTVIKFYIETMNPNNEPGKIIPDTIQLRSIAEKFSTEYVKYINPAA